MRDLQLVRESLIGIMFRCRLSLLHWGWLGGSPQCEHRLSDAGFMESCMGVYFLRNYPSYKPASIFVSSVVFAFHTVLSQNLTNVIETKTTIAVSFFSLELNYIRESAKCRISGFVSVTVFHFFFYKKKIKLGKSEWNKNRGSSAWRQDEHELLRSAGVCYRDRSRRDLEAWWLHFTEQNICLIKHTKWSDSVIFSTQSV